MLITVEHRNTGFPWMADCGSSWYWYETWVSYQVVIGHLARPTNKCWKEQRDSKLSFSAAVELCLPKDKWETWPGSPFDPLHAPRIRSAGGSQDSRQTHDTVYQKSAIALQSDRDLIDLHLHKCWICTPPHTPWEAADDICTLEEVSFQSQSLLWPLFLPQ